MAIKILRDDLTRDPDFLARFQREAQFVASLSHPNIVPVHDVGEEQGTHYIVMEYVRGRTLRETLDATGPMPVERAVTIMVSVLDALSYAHGRGLIHRDVKPHNILLTPEGTAKLADFGIARVVEGSSSRTAAILGSAQYLSPEQARGEEATVASDIYASGIVLYETVTGRPPFEGTNALAIAHHHLHSAPPRVANRGMPPAVIAAIDRALAKDPVDRFPNAAAFSSALSPALPSDPNATQVLSIEDDKTRPLELARTPRPPARPAEALVLRRSARKTGVLAILAAVFLAAAGDAARVSFGGYSAPQYPSAPYALIPALVAAGLLISWFYVRSWSYQMDGNAAVLQWGLIGHHRFGVPVRFITTLELKQSLIDRVLGLGTIELSARDEHGMERRLVLEDLPRPRQSYDELMRFIGRATRTRQSLTAAGTGEE